VTDSTWHSAPFKQSLVDVLQQSLLLHRTVTDGWFITLCDYCCVSIVPLLLGPRFVCRQRVRPGVAAGAFNPAGGPSTTAAALIKPILFLLRDLQALEQVLEGGPGTHGDNRVGDGSYGLW